MYCINPILKNVNMSHKIYKVSTLCIDLLQNSNEIPLYWNFYYIDQNKNGEIIISLILINFWWVHWNTFVCNFVLAEIISSISRATTSITLKWHEFVAEKIDELSFTDIDDISLLRLRIDEKIVGFLFFSSLLLYILTTTTVIISLRYWIWLLDKKQILAVRVFWCTE